jgi:hypothetical protein
MISWMFTIPDPGPCQPAFEAFVAGIEPDNRQADDTARRRQALCRASFMRVLTVTAFRQGQAAEIEPRRANGRVADKSC